MPMHPFPPSGLNKDSKVLILGSFPSVVSRELGFYYAHPQNRFWKVLADLFGDKSDKGILKLQNTDDKIAFLKSHSLVLWDIVHSCEIKGSSDSSLKNKEFNDIFALLDSSKIRMICLNGTKATTLFMQYCKTRNLELTIQTHQNYKTLIPKESSKSFCQKFGREITIFSLPSTSPANARYSFDNLRDSWKILLEI
ncbi:DNA-deoxyinosine glycosylase [Helicobacter sp. MIT 11-5569]|uniref:DNA-deoxyinosine glycosylase n=1 Tax=Helicobacter sp. MIT 11-5569 TaxID=1548151 RepID=UPI00051F8A82|nr:DNA-deoxyinosine glycosylase [Helicobacter sp. MIT 11-5569]TLD84006.1 DNA-deoxyinosine glycosylase [Helicobacter sp. MIT 11-5569]